MSKTANDVLNEWVLRGYITAEQSSNQKYTSYINQARQSIVDYCRFPPTMAALPNGLFYAWVEIGWATANGATTIQGTGAIKSVSEGDTTVQFDVGTTVVSGKTVTVDYSATLNRFRNLF